jgi:MYXO-CTERM domain-containing protein
MRQVTIAGVMTLLCCTSASADVVRPPPSDCVPGSEGTSSHSGPYCYPALCAPGCRDGKACESRKLCIVKKTLSGGRRPYNRPPPVVDSVVGSCDRGKTCASGECKALKVCVAKAKKSEAPIEAPVRHAGCGCSIGAASARRSSGAFASAGALALLALGLVRLRRRRR